MMSPDIFPFDLNDPNHEALFFGRGGGSMMAIGWPCRVTKTDRPVRFTLSRTAKQVALNFEIVILSIWFILRHLYYLLPKNYHSQ